MHAGGSSLFIKRASSYRSIHQSKLFQTYITQGRAAKCSLASADFTISAIRPLELIVIFNYPVIECLVAFSVVFLIGFICGKRGRSRVAQYVCTGLTRS